MRVYAGYNNDSTRVDSSSGGVFMAFARTFDVVYGVTMSEDNRRTIYSRADSNLHPLIGSKYIQAKLNGILKMVKQDLDNSSRVLFVGTACHVNGLLCFLNKEYENLITIDVICHGVPSHLLWNCFIGEEPIEYINFRAKDCGWKNYGMKINDRFIPNDKNAYMKLYMSNVALRPSCYECVCKKNKLSDITLGDFWGIDEVFPEMDDDKGVNAIIVRTPKGQRIFDEIKDTIVYKESKYEFILKYNPMERESVGRPILRNGFYSEIGNKSFEKICDEYIGSAFYQRMFRKIKSIVMKVRS